MKTFSRSRFFNTANLLIAITGIGLICGGSLVYLQQKHSEGLGRTLPQGMSQMITENGVKYRIFNGISYAQIDGWMNADGPFKNSVIGLGNFLLSPDYKEAGMGQLFVESGAYIYFQDSSWGAIPTDATLQQAVQALKNIEVGYLDTSSVQLTTIGDAEVIMFDAGHTTDGVIVLHKTKNGRWLEVGFDTVSGFDNVYTARNSLQYKVFIDWLNLFIALNP